MSRVTSGSHPAEVREWFRQAKSADEAEDRLHGGMRRGDEMPGWVADKEQRITKIRKAREALEARGARGGSSRGKSAYGYVYRPAFTC